MRALVFLEHHGGDLEDGCVGLIGKASLLVDYGGADIWVGHRHMNDAETGCTPIPERWIPVARVLHPYLM